MPMVKVEFSVDVKAKSERLWDIIADVKSWPEWQRIPYVKSVEPGSLRRGSRFVAELGGIKWDLNVINAERPYNIRWEGRSLGLRCIHSWEFHEEAGKTRAVTWETMSGWLLLLTYPIAKRRLSKYDDKWLADLKIRAEST